MWKLYQQSFDRKRIEVAEAGRLLDHKDKKEMQK